MITDLTYHDVRFGDTYSLFLDDDGTFIGAIRYLGHIGGDSISYDQLSQIPVCHQPAISDLIWKRQQSLTQQS